MQDVTSENTQAGRIIGLDIARSLAVVGMVIYHFTFDLGLFGFTPPDYAVSGFWAIFARLVAGSFMALAGFSLVLSHHRGIRWHAFWRRFGILVGAAALISVATFFAMRDGFIFFGILHSIALASLLGLAFLRLPFWALAGLGFVVLSLRRMVRFDVLEGPWFYWTGLGPTTPYTMDYEPVFPWFGVFLLGMALARLMLTYGLLHRAVMGRGLRWATWPGRHSLVIYLLHQPVLIGLFNAYLWLR